jgi:hypothetical protein
MGFFELLFVILLIGKLAGWWVISWGWVCAPLIPSLIINAIILCMGGFIGIASLFGTFKE